MSPTNTERLPLQIIETNDNKQAISSLFTKKRFCLPRLKHSRLCLIVPVLFWAKKQKGSISNYLFKKLSERPQFLSTQCISSSVTLRSFVVGSGLRHFYQRKFLVSLPFILFTPESDNVLTDS